MEVRTLLSGSTTSARHWSTSAPGPAGGRRRLGRDVDGGMYIRWAEQHGYPVEVFDTSYAEEAGIKSARPSRHQSVRLRHPVGGAGHPPAGPASARSTTRPAARSSFAEVEVPPVVETTDHIDIPETDIRVDVYRSSVQAAVGWTTDRCGAAHPHPDQHRGVTCQNEKSQLQNKVSAMRVLQAKLLERKRRGGSAPKWTRSRATAAVPGATRCAPTSCTRIRWSRICAPSTRSAVPRRGPRRRHRRVPRGRDPLAQPAR